MNHTSQSFIALACAIVMSASATCRAATPSTEVSAAIVVAPQAVPTDNIVVLNQANYQDQVDGSTTPVLLLIVGDNCSTCADVEKQVRDAAKRFPTFKIAIADVSLLTGNPVPLYRSRLLPSLTTSVPGHTFLYKHDNIDRISGGVEKLLDARAAAMTKLSVLYSKAAEVDTQIDANQQAFDRLDWLRKSSDRAQREHLVQVLAELYERKAAIIRQISPIVEDENDAGPAVK